MKKVIVLIFLLLSISCFSQAPQKKTQTLLKSDLFDENLKGPVKSYYLTAKYVDLKNKYNNSNRIATPKGNYYENVLVEYNKYGLMTKSLLGIFSDSLVLEAQELKNLRIYEYNEFDLIYKNKRTSSQEFPSMLTQEFYKVLPNRSDYYENYPAIPEAVHEIYGMNYDENKKYVTDRVFYRTMKKNKKLAGSEKEDVDDKNLWNKLHFEYSIKGFLKKITVEGDRNLKDINITYKDKRKVLKSEILFDYDQQERLLQYTVFTIDNNIKEEIGFVKYAYNLEYGYAESETIFQKYPEEYYLANVHNYTRKYNKQGDLIANLLNVEPKDQNLVRKEQLYLDKYYEYKYDEHNNWIECKIRVNDPTSEISAIMERKIEYFTE